VVERGGAVHGDQACVFHPKGWMRPRATDKELGTMAAVEGATEKKLSLTSCRQGWQGRPSAGSQTPRPKP
jgi:hypothetical protein